jgi:hypothetical protein
MWNRFLAAALLFAILPQAQARDTSLPILFGPEFTFSPIRTSADRDIGGRDLIESRQVKHLIEGQPEGAKFTRDSEGHMFRSPNGWSFTLGTDNGVVEVKMAPMTWPEYAHYASDIQDAIFTSAANEGRFPALFSGGGHISIGVDVLIQESPLLFRNLLADLINHSELFMGIFNYDTNNALPFPLAAAERRARVLESFRAFDRNETDLTQLISSINSVQMDAPQDEFRTAFNAIGRGKMHGFSLHHIKDGLNGRLELRGVRPQASIDVWVRQIRLLAKRIEFLRKKRRPIPVKVIVPVEEPIVVSAEKHLLNPPVNPQQALRAFHQYVVESGERWEDHKDYLWPKWISDGEVDRYEQSEDFKALQRKNCARALELAPASS